MLSFLKPLSVYVVFIIVLSAMGFYAYKNIKTKLIIQKTINSEHWKSRFDTFQKNPAKQNSIIFLGDSHTELFNLDVFGLPDIVNRGITGDFTEGLLLRLNEIIRSKPKKIFIEIGTNDIIEKVKEKAICENYERIVVQVTKNVPDVKIYIQSIFPVSIQGSFLTSNKEVNNRIVQTNENLKVLAKKYHLIYINLYDKLVQDNSLRNDLTSDGVHLNNEGYAIWSKEINPFLY